MSCCGSQIRSEAVGFYALWPWQQHQWWRNQKALLNRRLLLCNNYYITTISKSKSKYVLFVTQHTTPHTCIWRRHRTHTHTHTHADEVAGEIFLLPLTHPEVLVLPQGAPGAVGSLLRRTGTRPSVQSNLGQGQDRRVIFSVLLHVWVLCGGNPL